MQERAPAKINLCLHVTGKTAGGYHALDSLVVFAGVGDLLEAEPARGLSLALGGPFAGDLDSGPENLVLKAAMALGANAGQGAALRLTKRLPIASGIGGGSADAAAALRLLSRLLSLPLPADRGLSLGADVPVCLAGRPARMHGIGERLAAVPRLPEVWLLLVNDGTPIRTGPVFAGLSRTDNAPLPPLPDRFSDAADLAGWLGQTRNDLEAPARAQAPQLAEVLGAISAQPGCLLARMSGSGGTCFGLFATEAAALTAQAALGQVSPRWWCAAAPMLAENYSQTGV